MLSNFYPAFIFLLVSFLTGVLFITLGYILGPQHPTKIKEEAFECGFEAFEGARMEFDVQYYLVAILFILFDLEVAFIFPWALVFRDLGMWAFWAMFIFLAILTLGFIYEWKKGALEWE
ncbi:MAG: NADH-quinone oxidoreductase subunit A [Neisseriaceae bacterium]|nr:MAG: NADH-quinone oxidoreductase subunit A [Neisseriaceae bacterium]